MTNAIGENLISQDICALSRLLRCKHHMTNESFSSGSEMFPYLSSLRGMKLIHLNKLNDRNITKPLDETLISQEMVASLRTLRRINLIPLNQLNDAHI